MQKNVQRNNSFVPKVNFSVNIEEDNFKKLDDYAKKLGLTRSFVLNELLKTGIDKMEFPRNSNFRRTEISAPIYTVNDAR